MTQKLIIIGGVAGGATAAARARRLNENATIVLFERGEYISFANCGLPYFIGNIIQKRDDLLLTTPEDFSKRYNIDIRVATDVISIVRKNKHIVVQNIKTGKTYSEPYDKIILSPGAEPVRPPLEGVNLENIFTLRNLSDTDHIKSFIDQKKPRSAVIVGGGFIGIEMAENLIQRDIQTTIIEMQNQLMPPVDYEMAAIIEEHITKKGVECELGNSVKAFSKIQNRLVVSTTSSADIECDMVILAIGVKPENKLAKNAGLDIGTRGGIKVNTSMETSDTDIYAVGDAVEITDYITGLPGMIPLAGPANKQGRIAADNAMGRKSVYRGTLGTAVLKVFDLTVASTGANEKTLKNGDIPYVVSYTHSNSHASYYPGAEMMTIKLIFSPDKGNILGAQIIGKKGADKRIDILATAIRGAMTVYDLEELELAYAPPYSSAKDPVNIAGFVAANMLKGDLENILPNDLKDLDTDQHIIIDLRTKIEIRLLGTIKNSIHIPIDELRNRLNELDRKKTYILFCAFGLRGYVAHRILAQKGFISKNLTGGFLTYKYSS